MLDLSHLIYPITYGSYAQQKIQIKIFYKYPGYTLLIICISSMKMKVEKEKN